MSSPRDDDPTAPASGRVTVTDIAAVAGVSVMTVSRALSGKGYVAENTRAKILQVAESLGYVANIGAKAMKGGRTGVLGLLVSDFQSPVVAAIIGATSRMVKQAGLDLILYDIAPVAGSKARPDIGAMFSTLCDGLLLILPGQHAEQLDQFQRLSLPVVLVNYWRAPTPLPVVRADNYEGAYGITQHLLDLGHRRVAFMRGTSYSGQSAERERGYLAALAAAGVEPDPSLIVDGEFSQRSGFEQGQVLLDRADPPTAVFCANDLMAQGMLDAARVAGLSVPEQLSVVGFDDIPSAAQCHPALTTVRQDYEQLGENAVRLLLQHIEHGSQRGMRIELQSHLVIRDSTAPPPVKPAPAPRATAARKRV
ncbi:LacI family DNA-binding transcriptional regulator [Roseateles asaccharophilus]|uniref:LacI family transcriptional regulator n=1 Tax=Roseateles asaccharophilus TaxID=582607 RepID=A0ABU2A3Y8_9BURK|nr:LacI family DNA-binding transcriptional regulator [Roseateles asaccharophilus]MDR7331911.1 LacI family transcriptional regulator [Roseateles asaccharophilus]